MGHLLLVKFLFEVCHFIRAQRTEVNDCAAGIDDFGFDFGQGRVARVVMDRWR